MTVVCGRDGSCTEQRENKSQVTNASGVRASVIILFIADKVSPQTRCIIFAVLLITIVLILSNCLFRVLFLVKVIYRKLWDTQQNLGIREFGGIWIKRKSLDSIRAMIA